MALFGKNYDQDIADLRAADEKTKRDLQQQIEQTEARSTEAARRAIDDAKREIQTEYRRDQYNSEGNVRRVTEGIAQARTEIDAVKTASSAMSARMDARAAKADEAVASLEARLAGITGDVRSLGSFMNVVAPSAPVTTTPEAVYAFLAETDDKGYDAFRKGVLAKAMLAGKSGKIERLRTFVVYSDNSNGTHDEDRIVIENDGVFVYVGRSNSYVAQPDLRQSSGGIIARAVEGRVTAGEPIKSYTERHINVPVDKDAHMSVHDVRARYGGIEMRVESTGFEFGVTYKKSDAWGTRLAEETPVIMQAFMYGAFTQLLEDGKVEDAAIVYNGLFRDVKDPVMLGELAKAVEMYPGMVRYLKPVKDALQKAE